MKAKIELTTNFGMESVTRRELEALGYDNIQVSDGLLQLEGDLTDIGRLNLWVRSAERVHLVLDSFFARTFDELYEGAKKLGWADIIPLDGNFITDAKSHKSQLYSLSDIQSIVERAVVDRLNETYKQGWFEKTGARFRIGIRLDKDIATIYLDTTGEGLHKRGYRVQTVKAPLTETLAAGLVLLSYWRPGRIFLDPFCGSGTLAIEAALIARNIAPGLNRSFDFEAWPLAGDINFSETKKEAYGAIDYFSDLDIRASDINPRAIKAAQKNIEVLGLEDDIRLEVKDIKKLGPQGDYGVLITNPPYGQRISNQAKVRALNEALGQFARSHPTWSTYVLTGARSFEKDFSKKADRKRKLYNGRLRVDYYQYYGPRPPRD